MRTTGAAVVLALSLALFASGAGAHSGPHRPEPLAVVALVDTGINPYHEQFRDRSPQALRHPSTYIPGYPADAQALELTLDAPTYQQAVAADAHIWATPGGVFDRRLYWIPGTRIVGVYRAGNGGRSCPLVQVPPVEAGGTCFDRPVLDDAGHGTMTATRAASRDGSLAPRARIVAIEGLGDHGVRWATAQPWIDVQSHSWLSLVPPPGSAETGAAFRDAARRQLVFAASGNGLAYGQGVAPTPTQLLSTAAPDVVLVGAHDNGRVTAWSGAPAHVVADGYGGPASDHLHLDAFGPDPGSCCTSAAAPYAAGAAAAIVVEARRLTGDTGTGLRDDAIVVGDPQPAGPLDDGRLTLDELRRLVLHTAEARPATGVHDGLLHWAGEPRPPEVVPYGPGANPFCQGCWTSPVPWTTVAPDVPAYASIGYGALNERTVALAAAVLAGEAALPERPDEDTFFAADRTARGPLFGEL